MTAVRNIEELKKVKDRRPFEPFYIHLADGRELRITHPDNVAWTADSLSRSVFVGHSDGWEVVDLTLITSLRVRHSDAAKDAGI